MEVEYKIYQREQDNKVIVSLVELPSLQIRTKKKYTGRKAKIETIYRLTGKKLSAEWTTIQLNEYIAQNLYKSQQWEEYKKIFHEVSEEQEIATDKFEFQGTLIIDLPDGSLANEERIIHLLTCRLAGRSLDEYKGLKNTIISFHQEKHIPLVTQTLDECFAELISKREWYTHSAYSRRMASHHKQLFLTGKLPDETKRIYLASAGYQLAQPELWIK